MGEQRATRREGCHEWSQNGTWRLASIMHVISKHHYLRKSHWLLQAECSLSVLCTDRPKAQQDLWVLGFSLLLVVQFWLHSPQYLGIWICNRLVGCLKTFGFSLWLIMHFGCLFINQESHTLLCIIIFKEATEPLVFSVSCFVSRIQVRINQHTWD